MYNIEKVSRLRRIGSKISYWKAPNNTYVELPVALSLKWTDTSNDEVVFFCEATIELIDDEPKITNMELSSVDGLTPAVLQNNFRWQTPLDVVKISVPILIENNIDPFDYNYAVEGYPKIASLGQPIKYDLSDEFLHEIATEYLEIGRGYAKEIASRRGVSERTVVSWIQKARSRNILSSVSKGKAGGHLRRPPQR